MDPYIWDQGQELFQRGAAVDFAMMGDGTIQVKVLDPRDARQFFVKIHKKHADIVLSHCPCPYRLGGVCRHQVVALEYLRTISDGTAEASKEASGTGKATVDTSSEAKALGERGIATLYRLEPAIDAVTTASDGSLLRVVLFQLGSSRKPHRVGLQLYTGTGWTEVRTTDVDRWISRGSDGPHPRDLFLTHCFTTDGTLRKELDSETLSATLRAVQSSEALVDRSGRPLAVSPWPRSLAARLVSGADSSSDEQTLGIEFSCSALDGSTVPFDEVTLLPSVAPWIQLEDGSFCPLLAGAPGPFLEELQWVDFTTVPADELDRFLAQGVRQLERLCPGAFETEPDLIREVEGVDAARLVLVGTPARLGGRLELSYGGQWVVAPETPEPWTVTRDGTLHRYPPAGQSMARARRELEAIGFGREDADWVLQGDGVLRRLLGRENGFVEIVLPGELTQFDLVKRPPQLVLRVGSEGLGGGGGVTGEAAGAGSEARPQGSGMAWFQVDYELVEGGRTVAIDLPELVSANQEFRQGSAATPLVELDDGSVLDLRHDAVADLIELADAARAAGGGPRGEGGLRLPLALAGELAAVGTTWSLEVAPQVRSFLDGLDGGIETSPLGAETEELLRPYQRVAVEWLDHLGRYGLGGILADEMGLGKTVMSLSHFFGHDSDLPTAEGTAPILIVCPTSLGFNWLAECERFFPAAKVVNLCGQPPGVRRELLGGDADVLVTSYGLLRRDREWLEAQDFRAVLLDEAQHIKNAESQTAKAAYALRADERWGLTGTPVENHLGELWSIFHFVLPGLLGEAEDFQTRFAETIRHGEEGAVERLRARVSPFLLRRKKEEVLADLPPRIDQLERVPMTDDQRQVYDAFLAKVRGELETADPARSRFQVLAALTRLRQICCHPRLVLSDEEGGGPLGEAGKRLATKDLTGGKFELLKELLGECLEEGHRVLLFSQFTKMLDIIEEDLEARDIPRCRLDGSTRDREAVVNRFQQTDSIPIFLISLKAGGFGLNLTGADTVILYDPWWNPATEDQAASRAHRMGQTVPVHVHKLITIGTVEEKILELQATKRDLADAVIASDEEAISRLDTEELRELILG